MTFTPLEGGPVSTAAPRVQVTKGGRRYAAPSARGDLVVEVSTRLCADSMTGMPYPGTVTVSLGGRQYRGCGGEPSSLLQRTTWRVTAVDGSEPMAQVPVTFTFSTDGRVTGKASCNAFTGQYRLTGEGLMFSEVASTLMACPPPIAAQEDAFLLMLRQVVRFEIRPTGALVLLTIENHSIVAKAAREPEPRRDAACAVLRVPVPL